MSYDANGNLTSDGKNKYSWDAENRLHLIEYPGKGNSSQFDYDVLGRCERITERSGGSITASKLLLWAGSEICEERDSAGVVAKQFFPLAYKSGGATYFYTTDHLGSKREVFGGASGGGSGAAAGAGGGGGGGVGGLQTRLAYSPYGEQILLQGKDAPDFGYSGMYLHQRCGLNLTLFRQYDPGLGRWLSRDPIEESGGLNLYGYDGGNPVSRIDPLGLDYLDPVQQETLRRNMGFAGGLAGMAAGFFTGGGAGGLLGEALAPEGGPVAIGIGASIGAEQGMVVGAGYGTLGGISAANTIIGLTNMMAASSSGSSGGNCSIGKSFGKLGTVTPKPGLKITGYSGHGLNQALNRGVTTAMIWNTVNNPSVVLQQSSGNFLYLSNQAVVVLNSAGRVVTTCSSAYFKADIKDILQTVGP